MVFNMLQEDPGKVDYSSIGGLSEQVRGLLHIQLRLLAIQLNQPSVFVLDCWQIRELRESIELPLMNPELFTRVGIKPPKGKQESCCCSVQIRPDPNCLGQLVGTRTQ